MTTTKLKIGNRVRITDDGDIYCTYGEMADIMGLTKWKSCYGENDMTGVIVSIKKHHNSDGMLAGVDLGNHEIIINLEGLELLSDIPEKWCIQMTKENYDILYPWWKENIVGWNDGPILEGYTLLSKHPSDSSMYFCNDLISFLESHPEYTPITLEEFKLITSKTKPVMDKKTIKISRNLLNEYYKAATASQQEFINDNFKINGTTTVESIIELRNIACDRWKPIIEDNHPECFPVTKSAIQLAVEKAGDPNYSGCNVKIKDDLILVELPNANKEWSFAAFEWVMKFCNENPRSYPVHCDKHNNTDYLYIQWND